MEQSSCKSDGTCPTGSGVGGKGEAKGTGACNGLLTPAENPKPIILSYSKQKAFEYDYTNITTP